MKTKTFLFLFLFMGIGLTQLSAQNGKTGTGSVAYDYPNLGWWTPVYCDGIQVDLMEGMGDVHVIDHYKNGDWQWEKVSYIHGVGTSLWTGETFSFSELDKTFYSKNNDLWEWTCTTHVKGDKGSLYYVSFVWIWDGNKWIMNLKNASCTGNAK